MLCMYDLSMAESNLRFEWNQDKNQSNQKKHRVSFEEAQTVFLDERALLIADQHHRLEDRFILLGLSLRLRALVVCHCYREDNDVIRIISARRANRDEERQYNERWKL